MPSIRRYNPTHEDVAAIRRAERRMLWLAVICFALALICTHAARASTADTGPMPNDAFPPGTRYIVYVETGDGGFGYIPGCTTPLNQNVEYIFGSNPPAILLHLQCDPTFKDGFEAEEEKRRE